MKSPVITILEDSFEPDNFKSIEVPIESDDSKEDSDFQSPLPQKASKCHKRHPVLNPRFKFIMTFIGSSRFYGLQNCLGQRGLWQQMTFYTWSNAKFAP